MSAWASPTPSTKLRELVAGSKALAGIRRDVARRETRCVRRALARRGATVRAATRSPEAASFPAGVEAVAWFYDDASTWPAALSGVEALYFVVPAFRADEVELAAATLEAPQAAGVRRIVKLSASGVEGNPASAHRRVELLIETSGLAWVHLRPTFFQENFIEFYGGSIKGEGAIYLPAGQGRTGFVAAADIGEVAAEALLGDTSGEAWTLTGPESLDHDEVAAIQSEATGRPIRYVDGPEAAFAEGPRVHGANELGVATITGLYGYVRAGWIAGLSPDVERVLRRKPKALAEFARANAPVLG